MWGSIISGGASVLGGILGNKAASKEAEKQRDWSTDMSNTEMQRRVADLKAAGLNPMLAGMNQQGATNSGGAAAAQQNPLKEAGEHFRMNPLVKAQVDQSKATSAKELAEVDNLNARTTSEGYNAMLLESKIAETAAMIKNLTSSASHYDQQTRNLDAYLPKLLLEMEVLKADERQKDASTANLRAQAGLTSAHTIHSKLDMPRALNESRAQGSGWKRNVSPYLKDAGSITSMIGSALTGGAVSAIMRRRP